jgi:hypothetical protein
MGTFAMPFFRCFIPAYMPGASEAYCIGVSGLSLEQIAPQPDTQEPTAVVSASITADSLVLISY